MKKILSILLSFSILVGTLSVLTWIDAIANANNIFTNGDFEDSTENQDFPRDESRGLNKALTDRWYRPAGNENFKGTSTIYCTDVKRTGAASFKISTTAIGSFYRNFNVEKNTDYSITMYYRHSGGNLRGAIGTTGMDALDDVTGRIIYLGATNNYITSSSTNNEWVGITKTFNSGNNETLRLMFRNEANQTTYIDDIEIKKISVDEGVFKNGDFEDSAKGQPLGSEGTTSTNGDYENWYRNGYLGHSNQYSTEQNHTGNASLKLSQTTNNGWKCSAFFRDFEVEKNKTYTISFWYNVTAFTTESTQFANYLQAAIASGNTVNPENGNVLKISAVSGTTVGLANGVTDGWKQYTGTFSSGDNKVLRLIFKLKGFSGTVYFDDIVVEEYVPAVVSVFSNGDFEDSVKGQPLGGQHTTSTNGDHENWYRNGYLGSTTQYSTEQKHGGSASLKLNQAANYGWISSAYFRDFEVEKNKTYTISFWYNVTAFTTESTQFANYLQAAIASGDVVNPEDGNVLKISAVSGTTVGLANGVTDGWKQYTGTFSSGDNEVLRLIFRLKGFSGTAYIDDIVVEEYVPAVVSVFSNGDFEDSAKGQPLGGQNTTSTNGDHENWYRNGYLGSTTQYSTEQKHGGSASLKLNQAANYGWISSAYFRDFEVEKNKTYTISFWYNVTAFTTESTQFANYLQAAIASGNTVNPENGNVLKISAVSGTTVGLANGVTDGWKQYTGTFNSGDNEVLRLIFRLKGFSGTAYIDDIVVEETVSVVYNGSLEHGDTDWHINGNHSIVEADDASDGTHYLKVSSGNTAKSYFTMKVKKNTNYRISFDYRGAPANAKWAIRSANGGGSTATGADGVLANGTLNPSADWTKVSKKVNSGICEEIFLTLQGGSDGEYNIDNVVIEELIKAEIPNGDFEQGTNFWTINNYHSVSSDKPFSGENSLRIGGANYTKSYVEFNVNKNTEYRILLKYYAVSSTLADKWGIRANTGYGSLDPGSDGLLFRESFANSDDWVSVVKSFNSGDNETLFFTVQGMLNSKVYIDDIYLVEADGELLINGDFESGLSGWNADASYYSISTTEFDSDGAASLHAAGGYYSIINQMTALAVNSTYKLTFRYKGKFDNTILNYGVSNGSNFEESKLIVSGKLETADDWTTKSVVFNSGAGTNNETTKGVYVIFQCAEGYDFYIDNVKIEETDETPESAVSGVSPTWTSFQTRTRYISKNGKNLIKQNGFESTENATWYTESFIKDGGALSIVDSSVRPNKLIQNNNKILKFEVHGSSKSKWCAFYVDVEPNTEYYFTTWVLGEFWDATSNTNDMTFGPINANTGEFLVPTPSYVYSKTSGATLTSWDECWHLIGVKFNSGTATRIGIAIEGANSVAYFDDMHLVKESNAEAYLCPSDAIDRNNPAKITNTTPTKTDCDEGKNIVENYDFSKSDIGFWKEGLVYGVNVEVQDSTGTKGNSLHYKTSSIVPSRAHYIKWIDVEKNTDYTFSAITQTLSEGEGYVGIITDNKRLPSLIKSWVMNGENFDENYAWKNISVSFTTGGYDRIGFVICDKGGEFFVDNIKLFKTSDGKKATSVKDNFPTDIESAKYSVQSDILSKVPAGTKLSTVLSKLKNAKYIRAFDVNGKEITDKNTIIGTGVEFRLMDGYEIKDRMTVVINGDVDGDGLITKSDSSVLLKYLTKKVTLSKFALKAANTDSVGGITVNDAAMINASGAGKTTLEVKSYR